MSSGRKGSKPPRISVIIPVYRTEPYLETCLRSVMAQTMGDIEILCIDDASPDRSARIVRRLARRDARIRLIQHERNLGLGGARNTGIAAARGAFVTGIDSDDYMDAEMIERLWRASGDGIADVVACGMAVVQPNGSLIHHVCPPERHYLNTNNELDIFSLLNPSFCNKLWRKSLFTDNNIQFPEGQYYEDLATTPRLLNYARDIRSISEPLYFYVKREGSITNSSSPRHILDHFRTFDILSEFLETRGLTARYKPELLAMIGRSLRYHGRFIHDSDPEHQDSLTTLRHMLMLKLAYIQYNNTFRSLDNEALQMLLLYATSPSDVPVNPQEAASHEGETLE